MPTDPIDLFVTRTRSAMAVNEHGSFGVWIAELVLYPKEGVI